MCLQRLRTLADLLIAVPIVLVLLPLIVLDAIFVGGHTLVDRRRR